MVKARINKSKQKQIAKERISTLFKQAGDVFAKNKGLANRYVTLARKIAMKTRTRIPKELKRRYCKHCYKYLAQGKNAQVRIRNGTVIISCFECDKFTRIPLRKKSNQ